MDTPCPYSPTLPPLAFGHLPLTGGVGPRSPITGVTPWVRQSISGAQNLSSWSKSLPAHWGLTLWKISSGAAPQPRLALPNQRSRCVSWREPQGPPLRKPAALGFALGAACGGLFGWKIASGAAPQPRLALPNQRSRCVSWREHQGPPLQRDYVHISRLESCSLIRLAFGQPPSPKGEGFWATARVASTAYSAPVLLVRKQQAQLWNRTGNNFCKPRAQWPGGDSDQPLHFCAPEMMYYLPVGRPP